MPQKTTTFQKDKSTFYLVLFWFFFFLHNIVTAIWKRSTCMCLYDGTHEHVIISV